MSSSVAGAVSGLGEGSEISVIKLKGALCGRGEMSIESGMKLGEDEGIGGVVTPSQRTGGVVAPSASDFYQHLCFSPKLLDCPLTPIVELLEEVGGEEGPSRRCELGAGGKLANIVRAGRRKGGYLWSTCRFEDMSAAKLAVGDDPRIGCAVK